MPFLVRLLGRDPRPDGKRPPAPPALPPPPDLPAPPAGADPVHRLGELGPLVVSDDAIAVDGGRDLVTADDVADLAGAYWATQSWADRLNIVELTQDHAGPELGEIASDFLRAPLAGDVDRIELAKAICLGHFGQQFDHQLTEDFDRFVDYCNDRRLLHRKVDEALQLLGTRLEPPPKAVTPGARHDAYRLRRKWQRARRQRSLLTAARPISDFSTQ